MKKEKEVFRTITHKVDLFIVVFDINTSVHFRRLLSVNNFTQWPFILAHTKKIRLRILNFICTCLFNGIYFIIYNTSSAIGLIMLTSFWRHWTHFTILFENKQFQHTCLRMKSSNFCCVRHFWWMKWSSAALYYIWTKYIYRENVVLSVFVMKMSKRKTLDDTSSLKF